jgi:hypothetical protein
VAGNVSDADGAGVRLGGASELEAENSTLAGNRADGAGGGVYAEATAAIGLDAVTVARNRADADAEGAETGGGLAVEPGATAELANSLLALNTTAGESPNCAGSYVSAGGNVVGGLSSCSGLDTATDLLAASPRIGLLKLNGGPTATIALRAGSPAIGAAETDAPARDQRNVRRRDPDAGAFERR